MKKSRIFLRAAALIAALCLLVSCFAGCGSNGDDRVYRTYNEIKAAKKVKIGVSSDNNPFGFVGESGEYHGFEIYFADRLAKDMGVKVEYVSTEPENRAKYLEAGKVDIVIANYAVGKTAEKLVDFASPYMKTSLAAAAADGNKIKSLDKLDKKQKVIVVSGSPAALYMTENYPKVALTECADNSEAVEALLMNKGVMWLGDSIKVAEFAQQREGYSLCLSGLGDETEIAPAVSKGNSTLVKKINKIMKNLFKEDFFSEDYRVTLKSVFGDGFEESLLIQPTEDDVETETASSETQATTEATTKAQ